MKSEHHELYECDKEVIEDYRIYQLGWMLQYDITLQDIYKRADEYASDEALRDRYGNFERYLEDVGFGDRMWLSFDEWYGACIDEPV